MIAFDPSCRTCSGIHIGASEALNSLAHHQDQEWTPEHVQGDGGVMMAGGAR